MCSISCDSCDSCDRSAAVSGKARRMKITAGIGTIDDYIPFVEAGADEVFCGYVPVEWMEKAGIENPINRREVMYVNVQTGTREELEILAQMQADKGVPVTLALNSPFYDPKYYAEIIDVIRFCASIGIGSFIVADPGLLLALRDARIEGIHLHISGEAGEANRYSFEMARECGAGRIIFGRKTTIEDMRTMLRTDRSLRPQMPLEAEAFMLNEMCHFSGGFCCTYHCDELAPMCRVPYIMGDMRADGKNHEDEPDDFDDYGYLTGRSGCGLCALWDLREAGVTHLKVVSRGNYAEDTVKDIRALVRAMECLNETSKEDFIKRMKKEIFDGRCSGNCYYRT